MLTKKNSKVLSVILIILFVISNFLYCIPSVNAESILEGTTYYISNSGNNSNDGTSEATPWADFTNVNTKTFNPGDKILLERGGTWTQKFEPLGGSGTAENWIVVDAYGTGLRPIIKGMTTSSSTLTLKDASYWKVRNLEFSNAKYGPHFCYTTLQNEGIVIENNYVHDLYGGPEAIAIQVHGGSENAIPEANDAAWIVKDVEIINNEIGPTSSYGLVVMHDNTTAPTNAFQNIIVKNNTINQVSAKAIVIFCAQDSYWIGNKIDNAANVGQAGGTTASFLFNTKNMTIANNIFINTPNTNSSDQTAIDSEGKNDSNKYRGNYFANNYGGAIEFLMINTNVPPRNGVDYNTNNELLGNTFIGNGTGALWATTDTGDTTGTIKDSIYFENELLREEQKFYQWSEKTNNISIAAPSKIYNAGIDFGASAQNQWSYQAFAGSNYTDLTYDASKKWWGSETCYVSDFNSLAAVDWATRTWTAPYAGTISIRGQAFINVTQAGEATVRITKNGAVFDNTVQSITSIDGVSTNLDSIEVIPGDKIRFEVSGNTEVSWVPTIAYTTGGNAPGSEAVLPGAITDLSVKSKTHNKVELEWTSKGSDGNTGTASKYDIRYSTVEITEANWEQANKIIERPFPALSGTKQTVDISGLRANTNYYFAIKTYNAVPNPSLLSNVATCTTDVDITELQNPGFESGLPPWNEQGATAALSDVAHSGQNSVYVTSRVDSWGSVNQDITSLLNANGPGTYNFGVWAKYANVSSKAFVTIAYEDEKGCYWVTSHIDDGNGQGIQISTSEFTKIDATKEINWIGTLKSASIYFQSLGNTDNVYLDDFFIAPATAIVDKSYLGTEITRAGTIVSDEYTAESWSNLEVALEDAGVVFMNTEATQEEVDSAKNILSSAITFLEKPEQDYTKAMINPGFESGTGSWNGQGDSTFAINTETKHSGNNSLLITGRNGSWHGVNQDITEILNAGGSGVYDFGAWAKYATQSSRAVITVAWNDGENKNIQSHAYENGGQGVVVSFDNFTDVSGVKEIKWTGTLNSASIYFQSMQGSGDTDNVYLDDFFIFKIRKTPLMTLYNANKDKAESDYSAVSFAVFKDALAAAKSVIEKAEATQVEIDTAKAALESAIINLDGNQTVSKTGLNAAITLAQGKVETEYTSESWLIMQGKLAIAAAINADMSATQVEVNNAAIALNTAVSGLVQKPVLADKTELGNLYNANKDRVNNTYSDESWSVFACALNNALGVLEKTEALQAEADSAKKALETAISGLIPVQSQLGNAGFEAETITPWTGQDWSVLLSIDKTIKHSGENSLLVSNRSDSWHSAAQDIKNLLNTNGPGIYNFGGWAKFVNQPFKASIVIALQDESGAWKWIYSNDFPSGNGELVSNTEFTELSAVKQIMWTGEVAAASIYFQSEILPGSIANNVYFDDFFVTKINKGGLKVAYEMNESKLQGNYTDVTWSAFQAKLSNAKTVIDKELATQAEVDNAKSELEAAVNSLVQNTVEPVLVDKIALLEAILLAQSINDIGYTSESWSKLQAKLSIAVAVNADTTATQEEVEYAKNALNAAIGELVKPVLIDKLALQQAIQMAQSKDSSDYTIESWAVMQAKLDIAIAVNANSTATQEEVDNGETALVNAINGLVNKPVDQTPTEKPKIKEAGVVLSEVKLDTTGTGIIGIDSEAVKDALDSTKSNTLAIKVKSSEEIKNLSVNFSVKDIVTIEQKINTLLIDTEIAKLSINPKVFMDEISEESAKVEISISLVDKALLPQETSEKIGDNKVYDFNISIDKNKISDFKGNEVTVSIPYILKAGEKPNNVVVYYISDAGKLETVKNGKYNTQTGCVEAKLRHFSKYVVAESKVTFKDLASIPWATESIEALAARSIVSGTGNDLFNPSDKVTRAQFITMLMNAFDLVDANADVTFNDVKKGNWYYEAIASARQLGIIAGKSDASYGVDDYITRQDMAVIAYKVAMYVKADLSKKSDIKEFIDKAKISGYALEAVNALQSTAVVSGEGDSMFLPEKQSTRAQAVVVVYKILNLVK